MTIKDCWNIVKSLQVDDVMPGDLVRPLASEDEWYLILKTRDYATTSHIPRDCRPSSYFATVDNTGQVIPDKSTGAVLLYDGFKFTNWMPKEEFLIRYKDRWVGSPITFGFIARMCNHDQEKLRDLSRAWAATHPHTLLTDHLQEVLRNAEVLSHDVPFFSKVKKLFRFIKSLSKSK